MRSFTQKLAEFATTTAFEDISAEARSMVQLSLIDWAACARAGLGDPVAAILRAQAMEEGGAPQAGLVGGGAVPARMAALANGTIGRAAEFDDLCLGTGIHPSASVVPAALAVAQKTGADARSFQTACAVGMEGAMRMGMWLTASASGGETAYPPFDLTGISGGVGAVLAAAHLLQLTAADTQFALALVMDRARGAAVEAGAMGPAYDAGLAASYGVEAAGLAAQGGQLRSLH
ncbi:MmgE/PrpD family protein [Thalassobius sp. Cn5-15]|uniref:MmgE/PrpD family protein n=1 Tax=Thalassobius sp. Cn5-15 TaxID=2917763 RepID=UPI001EF1BB29|nr:MmgE/PrpD family protein [Thalassobius sp. Cn5-15]MCG7492131.1 MmgE/PrpD family protein [Thalassobius sp. Cn5-15]